MALAAIPACVVIMHRSRHANIDIIPSCQLFHDAHDIVIIEDEFSVLPGDDLLYVCIRYDADGSFVACDQLLTGGDRPGSHSLCDLYGSFQQGSAAGGIVFVGLDVKACA